MRIGRRVSMVVFGFVLALFVGVLIGPRVHAAFWGMVLDHFPNDAVRFRASLRLARSWEGEDALRRRIGSSDGVARYYSVLALVNSGDPMIVSGLLGRVTQSDLRNRQAVLGGLRMCSFEQQRVISSLCYELGRESDPKVRAEIESLLSSFKYPDFSGIGGRRTREIWAGLRPVGRGVER